MRSDTGRMWLQAGIAGLLLLAGSGPAAASVPYPLCSLPACVDPLDYPSYLFLPPGVLPDDYAFDPANPDSGSGWKYALSEEAGGSPGPGMNVTAAWQVTTGRPDVVVAVLDSGIRWRDTQLREKVALNLAELPAPCAAGPDCDGNGVVNVDDFDGVLCPGGVVRDAAPEGNANGLLDAQDLIRVCSDGVDDDANGFPDDIAGWDFFEGDNDPDDDVDNGHGTGQGGDMVGEADDGGGFPGTAPSAMFVPLRVGDSFVALDPEFVRAVVYAVTLEVDVISEALGTLGQSRSTQAAIDLAYESGIPIVASAADEQSFHHNWPAAASHVIWVNSIRNGDGTLVPGTTDFRLLNGCTNHGGKAWVAISSTACSSEATGRSAGMAALLVSHGKNLMETGQLDPYPGTDRPYSAEEIRQIFRAGAQDVDRTGEPLVSNFIIDSILSGPTPETAFRSRRFPMGPGWDLYSGYGRPDMLRMLEIATDAIPPEADLTGSLEWFDVLRPGGDAVPVRGRVNAPRVSGPVHYALEVGCGVEPAAFALVQERWVRSRLRPRRLGFWSPEATAAACGFDPAAPITGPDDHTVTLRLRVTDGDGNVGEDRRTVAIHADPDERFRPRRIGASGESSPVLADVDRDGVLEIVYASNAGEIHVLRGRNGRNIPGFPALTWEMVPDERVDAVPAYAEGIVPVPREPALATPAVDDLEADGRVEIVVASTEGRLYVFDDHGRLKPGFPVQTDPANSAHERRDRYNDVDPGFGGSPVLVDLDAPGADPTLEIAIGALDGHVYAWRANGDPVAGFPVRLGDRTRLAEDPATGRWVPDATANPRLAKIISSAAAGDVDGDGTHELVIATNEEYEEGLGLFSTDGSPLLGVLQLALQQFGIDDFSLDTAGRMYAIRNDGSFAPGFPVKVPTLAPGILPTVGTGVPGSPALARLDPGGGLVSAIFAAAGPVMLFDSAGAPFLGLGSDGAPRSLALDLPPPGFPVLPDPATLNEIDTYSYDAPFFGALGSGAFGDLDGDGAPEYAAPTGGIRQLVDVAAPASQEFGDHQIAVWNPSDGSLAPQFPRVMDDMQFLTPPILADVDGDGRADVVNGSGGYLVRAYTAEGRIPPGWPRFTHGWLVGAQAAGDVDGDGLIEIVAVTREGRLYVWNTPAPASEAALPWAGFGRDRRNTRNLDSGVSPLAAPRTRIEGIFWQWEAVLIEWLRELG